MSTVQRQASRVRTASGSDRIVKSIQSKAEFNRRALFDPVAIAPGSDTFDKARVESLLYMP